MGKKMGTPKVMPKEHANAPIKYDIEDMQTKDDMKLMKKDALVQEKTDAILGVCEDDDAECRAKSKATEDKPKDDTKVQLRDWDVDEDKEILESIKYAENKIGKKMPTPKVLPKEHANAPIKYDIEEMSQKEIKATHKEI